MAGVSGGERPEVAEAALAQARAAAPARSSWVSANAGSGKTRVLTSRVARLLLDGAAPEKILCLTYTKAAAAEMTNRLADTLGRWALLEDGPLREELAALARDAGARRLDAARLAEARRLFAAALETPGGLRIQTIHAFCDSVLRRFPLEAGVSPDFEVADDATGAALAERARDRLAQTAAEGASDAFDLVGAHLSEEGLDALIREVLAKRRLFETARDADALCAAFDIAPAALSERPVEAMLGALDDARLAEAAGILAEGGRSRGPAQRRIPGGAAPRWSPRSRRATALRATGRNARSPPPTGPIRGSGRCCRTSRRGWRRRWSATAPSRRRSARSRSRASRAPSSRPMRRRSGRGARSTTTT